MGKIYRIENTVNGKIYVGKTTMEIRSRWLIHVGEALGGYTNSVIHKAIRKYGVDKFEVTEIEDCADEILSDREIFWIRELGAKIPVGYNMTDGGEGVLGYRHTEETRARISATMKTATFFSDPERRRKISAANLGKHVSDSTRQKLRASRIGKYTKEQNGFYGKQHTEETKRRLSESRRGKTSSVAQAVILVDLEGNDVQEFDSFKKCYEWLYANRYTTNPSYRSATTQMKDVIRGKQTKAYGFTYRIVEKV